MKILDRFLIIIFNLSLLFVSLWVSIVGVAKSESFYYLQYKINGLTSSEVSDDYEPHSDEVVIEGRKYHVFRFLDGKRQKALFTNEHLEQMTTHIIDFIFGNEMDFNLELDGVYVYNKNTNEYVKTDNVSVFGEVASVHMQDVKQLFIFFQIICVIAFVIGLGLLAYLILRIGQLKHIIFEYTMFFYAIFFTAISVFFMIILVVTFKNYMEPTINEFFSTGWNLMHYIFFPFQGDKIAGSAFNDILTEILTLNFFITCVTIVVLFVLFVQAVWLAICFIAKIFGDHIGNKIKQKRYSSTIAFKK